MAPRLRGLKDYFLHSGTLLLAEPILPSNPALPPGGEVWANQELPL